MIMKYKSISKKVTDTQRNENSSRQASACSRLNKILSILSILFFTFFLSSPANAHRGAKGEVDTCRISVGDEVVHFSAYTPELSEGESYCHSIPELGLTHLVIDYEGKKLRETTVEFELTKEPEGARIYYQKPKKIKKGSIEAKIDFNSFGAGDYLAHITIVNQEETIDSHLPFSVAVEQDNVPYKFIIPIVLVLITLVMVSINAKTKYDDSMYSDS